MQRVSSKTGEEVPYERIVKGYELAPERYVLVEPEELDALDPEATHTIDIEEFVDLVDIDPIFFDSAYYLAPGKGAEKSYALLAKAMEEQGKVALARFVMRTKQYLASVRAKEGMLLLSTMVYADEVVPPEQLPELDEIDRVKVNDK
jgi:DNA end-binding protein Ku